jgi:hypothetical protein
MFKLRARSFVYSALIGVIPALTPAASHATEIKNVATLRCLDSNYDGSLYTLGCHGGSYQQWNLSLNSYGYSFTNRQTGRCLDSNTSGHAYTLSCNGGNFQRWRPTFTSNAGGSWEMVNVATLRVLDSNADGSSYTLFPNWGNFQRWYFY